MNKTLNFLLEETPKVIKNAQKGKHTPNYYTFNLAFHSEPEIALRWLLFLRDKKNGLGQREAFRGLLVEIATHNVELAIKLFKLDLAQFGRYDDELSIYDRVNTGCRGVILDKVRYIIKEDLRLDREGMKCSLLAKWMPSINTSSKRSRKLANMLMKDLLLSARQYRKILSRLRKNINVLERNLSQKSYSDIEYEKNSSKNDKKYNELFLKNDFERRTEYLKDKEEHDKKIQILQEYNGCYEEPMSYEEAILSNRYDVVNHVFEEGYSLFGKKEIKEETTDKTIIDA